MTQSAKFFIVMTGLRGCYMPDSCDCLRFATRRDLKSYLQGEADMREGFVGFDKHNITWAAAHAWRGKTAILPFGSRGARGANKPYAIEIVPTTRQEYLERSKENADA